MRYGIFSDIHGNLEALKAVLGALDQERVDGCLCLGDLVGYGPQPGECIHEVQKYNCTVIAGNHDYAVCGKIDIGNFNVYAREAILWTREVLGEADAEYLGQLPLVERLDGLELVHGSLYAPELFDYLQTSYDAYLTMERMETPVCFVGHSHVPIAFVQGEVISYCLQADVPIAWDGKVVVNVGSVGQPRDKDPRAAYAVYDTETRVVSVRRVRYDIEAMVREFQEAGLPTPLGERLRVGR